MSDPLAKDPPCLSLKSRFPLAGLYYLLLSTRGHQTTLVGGCHQLFEFMFTKLNQQNRTAAAKPKVEATKETRDERDLIITKRPYEKINQNQNQTNPTEQGKRPTNRIS